MCMVNACLLHFSPSSIKIHSTFDLLETTGIQTVKNRKIILITSEPFVRLFILKVFLHNLCE